MIVTFSDGEKIDTRDLHTIVQHDDYREITFARDDGTTYTLLCNCGTIEIRKNWELYNKLLAKVEEMQESKFKKLCRWFKKTARRDE